MAPTFHCASRTSPRAPRPSSPSGPSTGVTSPASSDGISAGTSIPARPFSRSRPRETRYRHAEGKGPTGTRVTRRASYLCAPPATRTASAWPCTTRRQQCGLEDPAASRPVPPQCGDLRSAFCPLSHFLRMKAACLCLRAGRGPGRPTRVGNVGANAPAGAQLAEMQTSVPPPCRRCLTDSSLGLTSALLCGGWKSSIPVRRPRVCVCVRECVRLRASSAGG